MKQCLMIEDFIKLYHSGNLEISSACKTRMAGDEVDYKRQIKTKTPTRFFKIEIFFEETEAKDATS